MAYGVGGALLWHRKDKNLHLDSGGLFSEDPFNSKVKRIWILARYPCDPVPLSPRHLILVTQ